MCPFPLIGYFSSNWVQIAGASLCRVPTARLASFHETRQVFDIFNLLLWLYHTGGPVLAKNIQ